jgi:hypothetical protein
VLPLWFDLARDAEAMPSPANAILAGALAEMAEEHAKQLAAAKEKLVADRRQLAETLAKPHERGQADVRASFVAVQATIEAIDRASGRTACRRACGCGSEARANPPVMPRRVAAGAPRQGRTGLPGWGRLRGPVPPRPIRLGGGPCFEGFALVRPTAFRRLWMWYDRIHRN